MQVVLSVPADELWSRLAADSGLRYMNLRRDNAVVGSGLDAAGWHSACRLGVAAFVGISKLRTRGIA